MIKTSLDLVPPIRGSETFSFCSLIIIYNEGWMMLVLFLEHHFCFVHGEGCLICLLQEDGMVDNSLSFDNDCDRQLLLLFLVVNLIPKRFVMIFCSCLGENYCVSVSFGNGVKFELGCNAW